MKKEKIKDLLNMECTQDEIETAIDDMPDVFAGKPLKANVRKYFKKDGSAKVKQQKGQEWHDTQGFLRRQIRHQIYMNRLRKRCADSKNLAKKKKTKTRSVSRSEMIEKLERKENVEKE